MMAGLPDPRALVAEMEEEALAVFWRSRLTVEVYQAEMHLLAESPFVHPPDLAVWVL